MKRLVVALQAKREQSDTTSSDVKKRTLFSKSPSRGPSELKVPTNTYSSSSSDGSAVQTPEPDEELETPAITPTPSTPRWATWIKSKSAKPKIKPVVTVWDHHAPSNTRPGDGPVIVSSNPESEDESDHYDDEPRTLPSSPLAVPSSPSRPKPSHSPARSSRVLQPGTLLRAQMNVRAITLASLIPPVPSLPLAHIPSSPFFPRSVNPSRSLKRPQTTRTALHKTILLRRLESQSLTASENESIAAFGHRPKYVVPKSRRRGIDDDETMSDVKKVGSFSPGLQAWLDRPCFEERCVMWVWNPQGTEVVARGIVGCGKAVALLEFSEGIEALAGYGPDPSSTPPAPAPSLSAPQLSPLRIHSAPAQVETISTGSSTPNVSSGPPTPTTTAPLSAATPRKVLRFMSPEPEVEEDNVPLGYQVRRKRGRELQLEARERRVRERERQLEEREWQAREEARMKKVYADEVTAARARREAVRSGSMHDAEIEKGKDRRSSYSRTAYDPAQSSMRRMASEPDSQQFRPSGLSRPASVVDVPATTPYAKPRPSSIRSDWAPPVSSRPPTVLMPPMPPLPTQTSAQSVDNMQEEKQRRRQSNISDGAGSTRSRTPSAPPGPPRPFMHTPTLPRAYSSGSGMSAMSMMASMPQPPPMPVMPLLPVMPVTPQFFIPQSPPPPPLLQMQLQYPSFGMPLLPPVRPGLPVSRSTEGLVARPGHSRRQHSSGSAAPSSSKGVSRVEDLQRAPRMPMQGPVLSFKQPAADHKSGSRGPRSSSASYHPPR